MSDYTASVFLDRNGQYAKAVEDVVTVRLFTGVGCDHVDITATEYRSLPASEQQSIKLLPGRPECIG